VDALAAIRPDDWNLALFLHVLGAMAATGALVLALAYLAGAWRDRSAASLRAGYRALLYGAIPGYLVMRLSAQWIYAKEHLDDLETDPDWIGIGFAVADLGLLVLIVATTMAGVTSRRALAAAGEGDAQAGNGAIRTTTILVGLLVVAYVVALWAMTTKP
jgi:hypothetical protein